MAFTFENEEGEEVQLQLPAKWELCDQCEGEGRCLMAGLRGVAFTQEEFAESFSDDEADAYFGGGYDTDCEACGASGKIRVPDESKWPEDARAALNDERGWRREEESERRMLAAMGGEW